LLNLVAGGGGIAWALQRLKARRMMDDTADELTRSMAALSTPAPVPVGNPLLKESSNGR
ncbi:phage holin family protein, partial [Myxococcus sp. CA039A]|nr:phage holin family protein [Myxococcus sp. CA039A]